MRAGALRRMRLTPDRLAAHLQGELSPFYLVHGEELLLTEETCDAIREAARTQGYGERSRWAVEQGFDWDALVQDAHSLSLFSSRKLVEIRMPSGRPGETGGRTLAELAQAAPADTVYMLISGKLERRSRDTRWYKAVCKAGVEVEHKAVSAAHLPAWLQVRLRRKGLEYEDGVIDLLVYYVEGNLLAAAQEVDKLALLAAEGKVTVAHVQAAISDNARFSAYAFVDACVSGNARKAVRILTALRSEGVAPALLLWAVAREVRAISRIAADIASGEPPAQVFKAYNVWSSRAPMVSAALRRLNYDGWTQLLRRVARMDRVLKGRLSGNVWDELETVALAMCAVPTLSQKYVTL